MGNFSTAIFIHNAERKTKDDFIASFCKGMKKIGYVQGTEEEAELSYSLAFSEKNDWVTLGSGEYEAGGQTAKKDAGRCAEILNTCCISISVVDSDFAILELYNENANAVDSAFLGRVEGPVCQGKKEYWEPFMKKESTWEQVLEIFDEEYVFVEDCLEQMAPLFGMDMKTMYTDWQQVDECAPAFAVLHFKKAEQKGVSSGNGKKITLMAAFKKIFGEALEPLGFVKMKGANHYFLRPVGDEILQVITIVNKQSMCGPGVKDFCIYGGMATVYRPSLDLKGNSWCNTNWLEDLCRYYSIKYPEKHGDDVWHKLYSISYKEDNLPPALNRVGYFKNMMSMEEAVRYSLDMTRQLILPEFDKVKDLESCLLFLRRFGGDLHLYDEEKNYGNDNPNNLYNEGLLYVKTDYRGDFMELVKDRETYEMLARVTKEKGHHGYEDSYDAYYQKKYEYACERRERLDAILDNPEKYSKAQAELSRRKEQNVAFLRSFGLDI